MVKEIKEIKEVREVARIRDTSSLQVHDTTITQRVSGLYSLLRGVSGL